MANSRNARNWIILFFKLKIFIMNHTKPILFVDLLFSRHGSYEDDFKAIAKALSGMPCEYLKINVANSVGGIFEVMRHIFSFRYTKIVFLSAKIWQLALFVPFSLFIKVYAIYHFMPNARAKFHSFMLPILAHFFSFATYSNGVSKQLQILMGELLPALPSRIIDKQESERALRKKFLSSSIRVLIPGIRKDVRKFIDPVVLLSDLNRSLGAKEVKLYIQSEVVEEFSQHPQIEFIPKGLPQEEYAAIYDNSHIVALAFEELYEVRASGIILDAIAAGCVVLSTEHPISEGYGYPRTLVCDLESIRGLMDNFMHDARFDHLIPGDGVEDFRLKWQNFLGE